MSQNTIDAIREAESAAQQQEKDAKKEAERIVTKARQDAEDLVKSKIESAKKDGERALERAFAENEEVVSAAKEQARQEIDALRAKVAQKEASAVDAILKELVS